MATLSRWIKSLETSYPDPSLWKTYGDFTNADAFRFARLWLSEGIPFAFSQAPAVYEYAREKFATTLGEHPKNVSMTGSGRLGFSLASTKFGQPYNADASDVDLFLVSEIWFEKLKRDAELFISRFSSGLAKPRNDFEEKIWPENAARLPDHIKKGFVNQKYIPNTKMYPSAQLCYQACYRFSYAVQEYFGEVAAKRVSVRVYKNWKCAESQIGGTLLYALKATGHDILED